LGYKGEELIFGDLLKWYDIKVNVTIKNAKKLYDQILVIERHLFNAFVSFILAKVGYTNLILLN